MKVSIGAPTYNDFERIKNLFSTIMTFTDFDDIDCNFVMLDDGTQDQTKLNALRDYSKESGIPLIENKSNKGIPYSWNRLTEYYDAEYVILFNDDIQIKSSNWLKNFIYFMDNNSHAGACGFPLIHINPDTSKRNMDHDLPNEDVNPGVVGAPVGCAFGFRKKLWEKIINPDGSIGFWENLRSFYEETSFGFEIIKMGSLCFMLPTPSVEHWGSRTFASNPEVSFRSINEYLPKEEYLEVLRKAEYLPISYDQHFQFAEKGLAYRMDYSRVMFAKKWGCEDKLNVPQVEVHNRLMNGRNAVFTKWIDISGREREALL